VIFILKRRFNIWSTKDPHITLLYGYDNSITPEMVKDVIDDVRLNIEGDYDDVSDRIEMKEFLLSPIEVEIDGIDIFLKIKTLMLLSSMLRKVTFYKIT
jgi:hypothetical protein